MPLNELKGRDKINVHALSEKINEIVRAINQIEELINNQGIKNEE